MINVVLNTTHRDSEQPGISKTSSRASSSVQTKQDIATAEQWWGSVNPNKACARSVGSPGPDSSSVRQNEISQQQKNSSRAVLTKIGHESGRLEAQGQTAVQCRQVKIS